MTKVLSTMTLVASLIMAMPPVQGVASRERRTEANGVLAATQISGNEEETRGERR